MPVLTDKQIEWLLSRPAAEQTKILDGLSKAEMKALKAAIGVYLKKKGPSSKSSPSSPKPSPEEPEQKGSKKRWVRSNAVHPTAAMTGEAMTVVGLLVETVNRCGNIAGRPDDVIPRDLVYLDYRLSEILRDYGYTGYSRKK